MSILLNYESWGAYHASVLRNRPVAYFSMEFGLHESLPIYSGGLGVLAGDHLKSASDLGIPLVGVGLLYNQGYFRQRLNADGLQEEAYDNTDTELLPIEPALGPDGKPVMVTIDTNVGVMRVRVWRVEVGRTTLYLLDSNLPENSESDRHLTYRLYGGDAQTRIRQEVLLGIGGIRALHQMGYSPSVLHLNEGHSAFAGLELIRKEMEDQAIPFVEAARNIAQMTVFTTHTPVAAGHDRFAADLVEQHLGKIREKLRFELRRADGPGPGSSGRSWRAVLHDRAGAQAVAQGQWRERLARRGLAPDVASDVPGQDRGRGADRSYHQWRACAVVAGASDAGGVRPPLRPDWPRWMCDPKTWKHIETVDDAELWEVRQVLKARLFDFMRRRITAQMGRRNESDQAIAAAASPFDLNTLTIGFARRFATYKRATLVMRDAERLAEIVNAVGSARAARLRRQGSP